ncbi:hypothetical protein M413DRAFT_448775 [Hebeloma cylindrosporum]|uniref:Uncharacterized protein n=1 Tax=Hebeloma cylindrosporum TaxID=76867 RepID=A0A0C3BJZ6_HEBCY|nr:hypothetical protein M413DRAFT_448775 [Hebeloma cylindrosporum h7]
MSSPITIPRSATSSTTTSSPASSPGLYVPVHKRSGSSSSRASSPSSPHFPALNERPHSGIYSPEFLLSLRPNADESVKDKMREACPEAVMNRRTRKNLEFTQHQREAMERKAHHHQPSSSPQTAAISLSTPFSASTTASTMPPRIMPRRNRPAVRATERRRQALQPNFNLHETWRGRIATPLQPLAVV